MRFKGLFLNAKKNVSVWIRSLLGGGGGLLERGLNREGELSRAFIVLPEFRNCFQFLKIVAGHF